ncbi:MAG: hypothetical protein IEMM0008_1368 [bacterium]|nr:MAG: hypothetical protein IEMM0008_1368 [bacterium]
MNGSLKQGHLPGLRVLGVFFLLFAGYIAWYTSSGDQPKGFWSTISRTHDFYGLAGQWIDQNGNRITLKDFRGKVTVISFIYLYCSNSCPTIIDELKEIDKSIHHTHDNVKFVVIVFDDLREDIGQMKKVFDSYGVNNPDRWQILTSSPKVIMNVADELNVKYSVLDDQTFNYFHTNLIAVIGSDGRILKTDYGLRTKPSKTARDVVEAVKRSKSIIDESSL